MYTVHMQWSEEASLADMGQTWGCVCMLYSPSSSYPTAADEAGGNKRRLKMKNRKKMKKIISKKRRRRRERRKSIRN